MAAIRYFLALFLILTIPAVMLYWFLIHPLAAFWRRMGTKRTYSLVSMAIGLLVVILYLFRKQLLTVQYGTNIFLMVIGLTCIGCAAVIFRQIRKQLTLHIMVGLPEVVPGRYPGRLLQEGIYEKIRHPRYVEYIFALFGYVLIVNYLAAYIMFLLSLPVLYTVILLEERELRQRFGEEYVAYCRKVPRFIPKSWGREG